MRARDPEQTIRDWFQEGPVRASSRGLEDTLARLVTARQPSRREVRLPLWHPAAAFPGTWTIGTERAQAAGLRSRPVAETVADVWAWLRDGGESELDEWRSEHRPRPMPDERERALIATLPSHRA